VLRGDTALKSFDDMLGEATLDMLREEGVDIVMHASPAALARGAAGAFELAARDGRRLGPFDCVLWAVGRMAAVEDLELAKAGVALDIQGFIATDRYQASSAPGIYAIGDVTGRAQLTPSRSRRAGGCRTGCLAGRATGTWITRTFDGNFRPTTARTVGLTEKAARERYGAANITVFRSSFVPLYHALTTAKRRCEMKARDRGSRAAHRRPARRGRGRGRDAAGVCGGGAHGATKKDFDDTVAIHPTSAEELVTMR